MADEPLQTLPEPEEEEGGPVKTFLEHLEDLRWVLVRCIAALLLGMAACLVGSPYLVEILSQPLENSGLKIDTQPLGPLGSVTISLKMALYGGMTVALPFILYFVGDFIMPALKKNEKKYFLRAFIVGGGLFVAGVLICYFLLLQLSLKGLAAYSEWMGFTTSFWRAEEYFHFVLLFMVGMGISFEIPVLLLTLVRMGLIQHETITKGRPYLYTGIMVVCAFVTPDAFSTIFMVIPVIGLMEICILISAHWERQKKIAEATAAVAASTASSRSR